MLKQFAAFALIISFCSIALSQTIAPKKSDADIKLENDAVALLRETSQEVDQLRTAENRISFKAELASLMWFHDQKEAAAMYNAVIADYKQLLSQLDMQLATPEDPDEEPGFGIFGSMGRTKIERKFRIAMSVRQQLAMSMAEHVPDLAYGFYFDSLSLISNPEFRKQAEQTDKYFESQLLTQIASTNVAKAAEYGKASMKRSGVDNNHLELLKKIYAKDADKGIDFGAEFLSRLKDQKEKNGYFLANLLSFGDSNLIASKKPGAKKPVYERNDLRDIADMLAATSLMEEGGTWGVAYISQIEKYSPGRAAQIRAKFMNGNTASNSMSYGYGTATATANAVNAPKIGNVASGDPMSQYEKERIEREAREKAEKKLLEDIGKLGSKPLPKEERDRVVAETRKIISQTKGKDKKIMAISLLAAQVAKAGDKELAAEIMKDAERFVNSQPQNYQDFLYTWMLASGYAESDPDKAFPIMENAIVRANDTLAAFVKVGQFIDVNDEMVVDGEVQVGTFGGSMMRGLTRDLGIATGTIRSLAKADLAKTKKLADTFDRPEVRVLAKMLVLRSVLDTTPVKTINGMEMVDGDMPAMIPDEGPRNY